MKEAYLKVVPITMLYSHIEYTLVNRQVGRLVATGATMVIGPHNLNIHGVIVYPWHTTITITISNTYSNEKKVVFIVIFIEKWVLNKMKLTLLFYGWKFY